MQDPRNRECKSQKGKGNSQDQSRGRSRDNMAAGLGTSCPDRTEVSRSKVYEKPVDELLDASVPFKPKKIIVDNMGIMYVTSGNINTGALMIDSGGMPKLIPVSGTGIGIAGVPMLNSVLSVASTEQ